jgi:FkbM family methyltransferase
LINRIWSLIYPLVARTGGYFLKILPKKLSENLSKKLALLLPHPEDKLALNKITDGPLVGLNIFANTRRSQAYIEGRHEPELVSWLQEYCRSGMAALDIGSHEGYIMLLMAHLVGNEGRVFAFEPMPELFDGLKITRDSNQFKQIVLENSAVGAREGNAQIHLQASERSASHSLAPSETSEQTQEINVIALDTYFEKQGWPAIDLIKLDVEGFETEAIEGMQKLLGNSKPICAIELHLWADPAKLVSRMFELGYQFTHLNGMACSGDEIQRRYDSGKEDTMIVIANPSRKN